MGYLVFGVGVGLIPSFLILVLHYWNLKDHRQEKQAWLKERESLLNRAMSKEWETFAQVSQFQQSSLDQGYHSIERNDLAQMAADLGSLPVETLNTLAEIGWIDQ